MVAVSWWVAHTNGKIQDLSPGLSNSKPLVLNPCPRLGSLQQSLRRDCSVSGLLRERPQERPSRK